MDKLNKFLDALYSEGVWNLLLVIALFAFFINLIVGVI